MMDSSLGDVDATQNYDSYNNTSDSYEYEEGTDFSHLGQYVWQGIILLTCCVGLVGNGYVIWLLGFQIKRNCFTTFILNLAAADFGYLATVFIENIPLFTNLKESAIFRDLLEFLFHMMYINANVLLTAISIDRCVAVLFPIWHRCSRPKNLSSSVCLVLWISSFLLGGIMCVIQIFLGHRLFILNFLLISIVCLPLVSLSTVVLFIKVCVKPKQGNKSRLLLMILITLLCFLILSFPLSVFAVISTFSNSLEDYIKLKYWTLCSFLFSCLNSSINPVIYFLIGRRKRGVQTKESMKVILQKVFKESEATGGN